MNSLCLGLKPLVSTSLHYMISMVIVIGISSTTTQLNAQGILLEEIDGNSIRINTAENAGVGR